MRAPIHLETAGGMEQRAPLNIVKGCVHIPDRRQ